MSEVVEFKRKYSRCCQGGLYHRGPFTHGDDEAFIECETCRMLLTPMAVLKPLVGVDLRLTQQITEKRRQLDRLGERCRTKCRHCGKMTEVNV